MDSSIPIIASERSEIGMSTDGSDVNRSANIYAICQLSNTNTNTNTNINTNTNTNTNEDKNADTNTSQL